MFPAPPVSERSKKIFEMVRTVKPILNTSRYRLLTEWYLEHPNVTGILRRAESYKYICENIEISIHDHEIFVGAHSPDYRGAAMYPETSADWIRDEVATGTIRTREIDPYDITDEDCQYVAETVDYWIENCNSAQVAAYLPKSYWKHMGNGVSLFGPRPAESPQGHFVPGHKRVLMIGLQGIRDEAQGYMDQMEREGICDRMEKYIFYQAIVTVCDGAIAWSQRYADLAAEKAAVCEDPVRKAELELIAETCAHTPRYAPHTYYEALQCVYFYQLCCSLDAQLHGISIGRVDQYFNSFYEKDLAEGRITRDEAQELMDLWYLKFAEMNKPWSHRATRSGPGYGSGQLITVGGVLRDGSDATNDITYMCLRVTERLGHAQPCVTCRIHQNMPDELWDQVFNTIAVVSGLPSFENDDVIIPTLMRRGFTLEDARDYSIVGCIELGGTGNSWPQCGSTGGGEAYINLPAALLHAINNGTNPFQFPGAPEPVQTGLSTGYLYEMENIEQVKQAYYDQLKFFMKWEIDNTCAYQYVTRHNLPVPIVSAAMEGCLEQGRDVMNNGAKYTSCGISSIGTGNVADSLAAIDTLCFKTKRFTTREFYDAMMANWEGELGEQVHAAIVNECPHFGNGDPYVDEFGRWVFHVFAEISNGHMTLNGIYQAGTFPVTCNVVFGTMTTATPDGRYTGEPLADGISGVQTRDVNGPLAVLKSVSEYDCFEYGNGTLFNMKFGHNIIANEQTRSKVRDLIETYFFDYNGMEIQLNFVDSKTMKEAQIDPEKHKDLIVRVAGFSAYFVEQAEESQNDLIRRTEQEVG